MNAHDKDILKERIKEEVAPLLKENEQLRNRLDQLAGFLMALRLLPFWVLVTSQIKKDFHKNLLIAGWSEKEITACTKDAFPIEKRENA